MKGRNVTPKLASSPAASKPAKPHKDFPLFAHNTRRWAKKIRGRLHYFGPWADPQAALEKWLAQKDDLLAGRTPRAPSDGLTVRDLVNRFLTMKRHLVDTRELTPRSFADYHQACSRVIDVFGKGRLVVDLAADDFEGLRKQISKTRGPVALGNEIQRIRVLFKYGYDAGLIDRPVRYGPTFKRPSKATLLKARNAKGERMFEAAELRRLIAAAGVPLKAMILLGINCGFGNQDVATLPLSAVDLQRGWVNYPRPKTGVKRRCKLWPETVAAIEAALAERPEPKEEVAVDVVFVTSRGNCWAKSPALGEGNDVEAYVDNPVTKETRKLLGKLKLHRPGLGFYALRHTFQTIGDDAKDPTATSHIMGHADSSMSAVYRERISDDRLRAVAEHVRGWLFDGSET